MTRSPQARVAPGFEAVEEAFRRNGEGGREGGAAFAAYYGGRLVVDLWVGDADASTGRAWDERTLAPIFSGTKGLAATCLLLLADRGLVDLDAPLHRWWPAFAAGGRRAVLVRHVVSHTAGLPGIRRRRLRRADLLDDELMGCLVAEEEPVWEPGSVLCYHSLTYGWLVGELVRRVDGRSIGRFFDEEIARPLGLDLWIGLPPEHEPRVARLEVAADWGATSPFDLAAIAQDPVGRATYGNPAGIWDPAQLGWWDEPAVHRAEIAGAGAIGSAAAIARLYGCLAVGGELDGVRLLSPVAIARAREPLSSGSDALLAQPAAYGAGFALQTALGPFGIPPDAFGHCGMGGSTHGAWPLLGAGFSYVPGRMYDDGVDQRAAALLDALHESLTALSGSAGDSALAYGL